MSGGAEAAFAPGDVTRDRVLGGRVTLDQPRRGYRGGVDPVLLAAAVPARPGDRVLELGCGAGMASLCLAARVPGLSLTGVELQPAYAALARHNAALNGAPLEVLAADLAALPPQLRQLGFQHVFANPPYHAPEAPAAQDAGRAAGRREETPLAEWIAVAARRLAPRGMLTLILPVARLPAALGALDGRLGSVEALPLAPRAGRAPKLCLLRARKDGRAPFRLHHPLCLHAGACHGGDGEDYTPAVAAVLRDAAPLPFPG